jgi:hypothetical protein
MAQTNLSQQTLLNKSRNLSGPSGKKPARRATSTFIETPAKPKRVQTIPNKSKHIQTNPNKSKHVQTNPNKAKQIQTNPNMFKQGTTKQGEPEQLTTLETTTRTHNKPNLTRFPLMSKTQPPRR